ITPGPALGGQYGCRTPPADERRMPPPPQGAPSELPGANSSCFGSSVTAWSHEFLMSPNAGTLRQTTGSQAPAFSRVSFHGQAVALGASERGGVGRSPSRFRWRSRRTLAATHPGRLVGQGGRLGPAGVPEPEPRACDAFWEDDAESTTSSP